MNARNVILAAAALGLAACSDDAPPNGNPPRLWLALDGSEIQVRLVSVEPPPF
ncbi:MAG TPA: hypothetical protein VM261_08325 [Kofleriaceae bacterium]|nr:hypothetical protein [Kofleriaceae bacterium]